MKKTFLMALSLELIALATVHAQAPTGAIAGVVADATGATIPSARVVITNKDTNLKRVLVTGAKGDYSASEAQRTGKASEEDVAFLVPD